MVTADGVTNPVEELTVLYQRINHANSGYHPGASIGSSWR